MKLNASVFAAIGALIVIGAIFVTTCLFTVPEWEQAIVTQFGEIQGEPITKAGLYFKLPWQNVERFDRRLLRWDGQQTTAITRDRRTINIDVTARWRISDARLFMETTRSISQADLRLNGIIEGAVRDEIAKFELFEVIRSSNRILDNSADGITLEVRDDEGNVITADDFATLGMALPRLTIDDNGRYIAGRPIVLENILTEARRRVEQVGLGIHVEDVMIKQLGYIREIEANVFAQMNAELNKIAAGFRSAGQERAERRLGEMSRELSIIESSAIERAQRIRGQAEAEATAIFADAFSRDPEFYDLVRSLEAFERILGSNSQLIISTDSNLFNRLKR